MNIINLKHLICIHFNVMFEYVNVQTTSSI